MKHLLDRLHAKLGDFWWYSLMLFVAARAADVLNLFVGLWLVPKYVDPAELGAVLPLTQFASFLAIPIGVIAATFRNELTTLAINRKFGQMKTLMRTVFIAAAVFLFLALVISRLILPAYRERIRIAEGSLGLIILACSFVSTVSPIYTNTLQALKKFKANSLISLIGAPVRLIGMLVTMPFRALTGFFVGQTCPPAFAIGASVLALRKELSVPAEPYWNRKIIRALSSLALIFLCNSVICTFASLVETTVLRQRLPALDSAAYYIVTRFSDIASFLACALCFTIFPFTAELAAKGKDTRPLIVKASLAVIGTNLVLAAFFCLVGEKILSALPHGAEYSGYWWVTPWMIAICSVSWVGGFYTTGEISAFRFGYLKWWLPIHFAYAVALLLITGHGYYDACLPTQAVSLINACNITSLHSMLWWMTCFNVTKLVACILAMLRQRPACAPSDDVLSYSHAAGTGNDIHDGQPDDGCGLHPFAARRERALSDLGRVRVLAEATASQPGRTPDCGPHDSLRKVIEVAKSCGLYFTVPSASSRTGVVTATTPNRTIELGELVSKRTGESEVYFNASEHVYYKVKRPLSKSPIKNTSEKDWFYEHIIHNILFPKTAYDFIGITEEVGEMKVILRQEEVQSESFPTDAQIAAHLASLGLKPEDRYFFGNDLLAVTDVSAQSDNILLDDSGNLRFIDPLIRLKKPAKEIISQLVGSAS